VAANPQDGWLSFRGSFFCEKLDKYYILFLILILSDLERIDKLIKVYFREDFGGWWLGWND
jgi:hypothetical protein